MKQRDLLEGSDMLTGVLENIKGRLVGENEEFISERLSRHFLYITVVDKQTGVTHTKAFSLSEKEFKIMVKKAESRLRQPA